MKKNAYKIYFQMFGKKMKYVVFAESKEKAIEELKSKIQIDEVKTIDHSTLETLAKELDKTFQTIDNAINQFSDAFTKSIDKFFNAAQNGIDAFGDEWNKNKGKNS